MVQLEWVIFNRYTCFPTVWDWLLLSSNPLLRLMDTKCPVGTTVVKQLSRSNCPTVPDRWCLIKHPFIWLALKYVSTYSHFASLTQSKCFKSFHVTDHFFAVASVRPILLYRYRYSVKWPVLSADTDAFIGRTLAVAQVYHVLFFSRTALRSHLRKLGIRQRSSSTPNICKRLIFALQLLHFSLPQHQWCVFLP